MPTESFNHWERQIRTPYSQLSDAEKRSDVNQVNRYLPLFEEHIEGMVAEYMKALGKEKISKDTWKKIASVNGEYLLRTPKQIQTYS